MRKLIEALRREVTEEISDEDVRLARDVATSISSDVALVQQMRDRDFEKGLGKMADGLRELGMGSDADKLEDALGEIGRLEDQFNSAVGKQARKAYDIAQRFDKKAKSTWR